MIGSDYSQFPSIRDIVNERLNNIAHRIVMGRMNGASLRDVALTEGIQRSEARHIEREALEQIFTDDLAVSEDAYKYLYTAYNLDDEFYLTLPDGVLVFYYLKSRYEPGYKSATKAISDENLSSSVRELICSFYNLSAEPVTEIPVSSSVPAETTIEAPIVLSHLPAHIVTKIDDLWSVFLTAGITDSDRILEQLCLFFLIKKLDDEELFATAEAIAMGKPVRNLYFDSTHQNCRWSSFHNYDSYTMYQTFVNEVIPWVRNDLSVDTNLTVAQYIRGIHLRISDAYLLSKIVTLIDSITSNKNISLSLIFDELIRKADYDTELIKLAYRFINPSIESTICCPISDPSLDLSIFSRMVREDNTSKLEKVWNKAHFNNEMFVTYSPDISSLLISSLRLYLEDIKTPLVKDIDIVSDLPSILYSGVVASIPSKKLSARSEVSPSVKAGLNTSNISLNYMYVCHKLLADNGVGVLLVPHKVLVDSTSAHKRMREFYLRENTLICIIYLPNSNQDLLVYKACLPTDTHSVWFAKITNEISVDSVYEAISEGKENSSKFKINLSDITSLNYIDYVDDSGSDTLIETALEPYSTIMRRVFEREAEIAVSIQKIKEMLEDLS